MCVCAVGSVCAFIAQGDPFGGRDVCVWLAVICASIAAVTLQGAPFRGRYVRVAGADQCMRCAK
jgi:hypothetical protein